MKRNLLHVPKSLFIVLMIACTLRIIVALMSMNFSTDYYWEYGEIAKNILAGRGYSLFYISSDSIAYRFNPAQTPFPSALMSPGYVGFLLPFMEISNNAVRNVLIVAIQTAIALLTILLLYKFTAKHFSPRAAIFASIAACILPDFMYAVVSFSPTVLYQCLIIALIYFLYDESTLSSRGRSVSIAFFLGVIVYIRSEFLLFVLMYLFFRIFSGRWRDAMLVFAVTAVLLSPWTIRNSYVFNQYTPIGTGFGMNFYRGHNAEQIGIWGNDALTKETLQLPRNQSFEVSLNHFYTARALEYIVQHPVRELSTLPSKLSHLWIASTLQEHRYTLLYQTTSWFVFIFFSIGLLATFSWKRHKILYLFLLYSTMIAIIFFTLPRHQTMMRIAILPFIGAGLEYIWTQGKKFYNQSNIFQS